MKELNTSGLSSDWLPTRREAVGAEAVCEEAFSNVWRSWLGLHSVGCVCLGLMSLVRLSVYLIVCFR